MAVDGSGIWRTLLRQKVFTYIQNPITRADIQKLWEEHRYEELEKRMRYLYQCTLRQKYSGVYSRRIGFGTAGSPCFFG